MAEQAAISVVIPAYNSAHHLQECLQALATSSTSPFEVIVADDCSTDDCEHVAIGFGARVIRMAERSGPARARNKGAKAATGDVLLFLDADVCVHRDTVEQVAHAFSSDPDLDVLVGSFDDAPRCNDFLSQYRNLMHAFVHYNASHRACTFFTGIGAIRKDVFEAANGFDESFARPTVEDIELGYRLHSTGRKMVLEKDVQATHLKRWGFWNMVRTDIFCRGIPWTELILRDRHLPNDLNLQTGQRVSVVLAFLLSALILLNSLIWGTYFVTPLAAASFLMLGGYWAQFLDWKKKPFLWTATLAALIVVAAGLLKMYILIPPFVVGCISLFADRQFRTRYLSAAFLLSLAALAVCSVWTLPRNLLAFSTLFVLLLSVALNHKFYFFLSAKRGWPFALAAVPFHLLYHLYSGLSFIAGVVLYLGKTSRIASRKPISGMVPSAPDQTTEGL